MITPVSGVPCTALVMRKSIARVFPAFWATALESGAKTSVAATVAREANLMLKS
jgi:hypothetical protein